jgi:CubicO group peptidase (beta-lactamase class C family)
MGFWLNEAQPRHVHVTDIVLNRSRQRGTRGAFSYNNENYALLGRIIEVTTGQSYVDACQARVLDPAGVSATLSPRFGAYAAWGGWRMSMADHARLLWYWFGPQGRVGRDPLALPRAERAQDSYYGLGMNFEVREEGVRMSHAGAISIPFGPKTGAYAVLYPFGAVSAMGYDVAVADPARFYALSERLEQVLRDL